MNKERRKQLNRLLETLADAEQDLSAILEEEQNAFDNLPEGLQGSEMGVTMEEGISTLEDCVDSLQDIQSQIQEVAEG